MDKVLDALLNGNGEDFIETLLKSGKVELLKKLPYHDDFGNLIEKPEDLGGQCKLGEHVHKNSYYTCMECGENFCRKHVKFVDGDPEKPLCYYKGSWGMKGCYECHSKEYYRTNTTKDLKKKTEKLKLLIELEKTKRKYLNLTKV